MQKRTRLSYVDVSKAQALLECRTRHHPNIIALQATEPNNVPQRRWATLVSTYLDIGMCHYALGEDISVCRQMFSKALDACIELFVLRGTQEEFPVLDLIVDTSKPKGDSTRSQVTERREQGSRDYSLTNSKDAYWYVCLGLAIGEVQAARRLASMMWDPPDVDFIGPKSMVCTPNQQAVAYALRYFLEGQPEQAAAAVSCVRTPPHDYVGLQAQLVRCLLRGDGATFLRELPALLARHAKLSRREAWNPELYMCVPALGLAALAMETQLVTAEALPQDVYLPSGLRER